MRNGIARVALVVVLLVSVTSAPVTVQGQNTAALCILDNTHLGGSVRPLPTGWQWALVCAMGSPPSGLVQSDIVVDTLAADNLAAIGLKLANAVKAYGATVGWNVTTVLLPTFSFVTPQ